jgi:hypothetical protein
MIDKVDMHFMKFWRRTSQEWACKWGTIEDTENEHVGSSGVQFEGCNAFVFLRCDRSFTETKVSIKSTVSVIDDFYCTTHRNLCVCGKLKHALLNP